MRDELLIAYETDDPVENVLFQKERLVRVNAAKTAFRGVVFERCTFEAVSYTHLVKKVCHENRRRTVRSAYDGNRGRIL